MRIWDISMSIHLRMPVWKGRTEKRPQITITRDYVDGEGARESRIDMDLHTGTHIDAPLHFVYEGQTIDNIPLEKLVRTAKVIDLTMVTDKIERSHLVGRNIVAGDFVLLKTLNSTEDILEENFVFISEDAATFLVELGVEGVGIDGLGVERDQSNHGTHLALLGAGVVIIEGLRLNEVPNGNYLMIAAPLKLNDVEAAPARVLLIDEQMIQ